MGVNVCQTTNQQSIAITNTGAVRMSLAGTSLSIVNAFCERLFRVRLEPHAIDAGSSANEPVLDDALRRLQTQNIEIASLIDVGAAEGYWSTAFAKRFPGRHHLLVEANDLHQPTLERVCQENKQWQFALTATGGTTGTAYFDGSDPLGGHLSNEPWNENYRPCSVSTLDDLVEKYPVPGPFMIKLDTHGVEIPILSGAGKTLKQTNAIVVEAYNFTFGGPAVPFWDLCRYMLELGFRPLDVFDLLYREVDGAFWQFDLLFARSDHPLFQRKGFFTAGRH
jgi:FkbM family methyltransferase